MKTILFYLIFCFSYLAGGQTFQEIQFDNFTPIWVHYTKNDIKNNLIQSYRSKKHILSNDKVYVLNNAINDGFTGHIVESIDLKTGNLLWNYSYYPSLNNKKEYAANLLLKNESTLEVLSVININNDLSYWDRGVLGRRVIDAQLGEITDSVYLDAGFRISIPTRWAKNINLSMSGTDFRQFQMQSLLTIEKYKSILFSKSGEILDVFERLKFGKITEIIKSKSLSTLDDGSKFLMTHYVENENKEQFHINVLALSQNLDTISYFTIEEGIDAADKFEIVEATKDYILLKSLVHIYNGTYKYKMYGYYLFDLNGTLLDKVILENITGEDKFDGGMAIKVRDENRIFCVYSGESNGFQKLIFAKSDGLGNFNTLKEVQSTTKDDWFRCKSIDVLSNNDILINLRHSNRKYVNPYAEKSVWMLITEDQVSSSAKSLSEAKNFEVYPNPTSGEITIKSSFLNPSKIVIFDLLGIQRKVLEFKNNVQLSDLPSGIYFIELLDSQNNTLATQKIILD